MRVIDSILKWAERNKFKITNSYYNVPSTYIHILDEKIEFSLNERVLRSDHVKTKEEIERSEEYSYDYGPRYDYSPTGKLMLEIKTYRASGLQKIWKDNDGKTIESQISGFCLGLLKIAILKMKATQKRKEEERQWQLEYERRKEIERQRIAEAKRSEELEEQAYLWDKSQKLQKYIKAVKLAASERQDYEQTKNALSDWVLWAEAHAYELNPIKRNLPFENNNVVNKEPTQIQVYPK